MVNNSIDIKKTNNCLLSQTIEHKNTKTYGNLWVSVCNRVSNSYTSKNKY